MSDNPFAEPDDADRTVIRPAPGGAPAPRAPNRRPPRRASSRIGRRRRPQRPAARPRARKTIAVGVDPLAAAAAPLLQLWRGCATRRVQPDPGDLRERASARSATSSRGARQAACRWSSSAGALRAVRQPRRRRAEHALGQQRRLGRALAGLDLPPGGAQRRALLRSAEADAAEPRHVPAGASS